ncbi:MntP/YtaF family protein [Effusibacillus pohliae]|uniref:MntP/YtaF family protein n=1 Tax=Effusibacillus pohliae TaxID=232270 RepID=UPI000363BF1F|nr:MntP/YtaF family protein [Effusibacillus pohliae]
MQFVSLFMLAFAVSLDGFGVGITYGLRTIRFPWWSLVVVTLLSATMILVSMSIGGLIVRFMSPGGARLVGACILIAIGGWAIVHMLNQKDQPDPKRGQNRETVADCPKDVLNCVRAEVSGTGAEAFSETKGIEPVSEISAKRTEEARIFKLELRKLGLVIQILKTPSVADIDQSGSISAGEAFLLGMALSMDAFGAGIGASLIGYPPLATAVVISLMSMLFISIGLKIGHKYAEIPLVRRISFLPGLILILIGLTKMFS